MKETSVCKFCNNSEHRAEEQNTQTDGTPAVGSTGLLAEIRQQLLDRAAGWRNSPDDSYNIANAVQVTLTEVANSINAAIKANTKLSGGGNKQ